ncbi:MAG: sigma-70 family RNA polymerase sigma factor [Propionibacteriaceae bacterium]|nr:sigma-70 family RNA polymerase sigma factor [Propionibacteriaceae bacterium]
MDPDDVVAEAFTRIWSALCAGGGPEQAFGPYLRATVRNVAITLATTGSRRRRPTTPN